MYARNVTIHLKPNMLSDYTRTFEKDVLPLLRKQNGFKDEIAFSAPNGTDDNKANAEAYNKNIYPDVVKTLARVMDGSPKVQSGEVVNSTIHQAAA
jgi:hypothetical protein